MCPKNGNYVSAAPLGTAPLPQRALAFVNSATKIGGRGCIDPVSWCALRVTAPNISAKSKPISTFRPSRILLLTQLPCIIEQIDKAPTTPRLRQRLQFPHLTLATLTSHNRDHKRKGSHNSTNPHKTPPHDSSAPPTPPTDSPQSPAYPPPTVA